MFTQTYDNKFDLNHKNSFYLFFLLLIYVSFTDLPTDSQTLKFTGIAHRLTDMVHRLTYIVHRLTNLVHKQKD